MRDQFLCLDSRVEEGIPEQYFPEFVQVVAGAGAVVVLRWGVGGWEGGWRGLCRCEGPFVGLWLELRGLGCVGVGGLDLGLYSLCWSRLCEG